MGLKRANAHCPQGYEELERNDVSDQLKSTVMNLLHFAALHQNREVMTIGVADAGGSVEVLSYLDIPAMVSADLSKWMRVEELSLYRDENRAQEFLRYFRRINPVAGFRCDIPHLQAGHVSHSGVLQTSFTCGDMLDIMTQLASLGVVFKKITDTDVYVATFNKLVSERKCENLEAIEALSDMFKKLELDPISDQESEFIQSVWGTGVLGQKPVVGNEHPDLDCETISRLSRAKINGSPIFSATSPPPSGHRNVLDLLNI